MNNINELAGDHLFQLNLMLWLTQPAIANVGIRSLFAESGFSVYSISPPLALPILIREKIRGKNINAQDSCLPDIILEKKNTNLFLLIECKKQSFSENSSAAEQARTLLLLEGQTLGEALALSPTIRIKSAVSYVLGDEQKLQMENTCKSLKTEIESVNLKANFVCCLGIKCDAENSIYMTINHDDAGELGIRDEGVVKIIEGQPDTDPRPLFFIPLDPSVEQTEYGRKTLEQRLLSEILSLIGRVKVPGEISFTLDALLEKATWGMYSIWGDRNAKVNLRRQVNDFIRNKIVSLSPANFQCEQNAWIFTIESGKAKESILLSLQKIKTVEELKENQLDLFDENKSN